MMSSRRPSIVALAASAVAFASPCAFAAEDWAAVIGGGADEQMVKRLESNVRAVPGTDTRFLIGGFAQLDGLFTRDKQTGEEQATFLPTATPFGPAHSDQRASIRQSQLNWLSYTPSPLGTVTVRAMANLFSLDYDGKTKLSLWQLYVGIADALVVGKAYSTFVDPDVLPTTLDFNGPAGATAVQQWLVRASFPLGAGWTLAGGIEDPQAKHHLGGPSFDTRTRARRPDLAAHLRHDFARGHVQIAALSRRVELTATTAAGTFEREFDGSGIAISGSLATFGDDSVVAAYITGKGIGRYFNDAVSVAGASLGADGRLELARGSGATLYYQRFWTPDWMTVAGASTQWASDAGARSPDALNRIVYASTNLIHRFTPTILAGVEGLWGRATRVDGVSATNARLQVSLRYLVQ
jgi:hypothetical protein